ncbi:MAG TPA: hypothetical protein VMU92_06020 [Acidobacteriaceae bacterium]|nr:hypothetical protein [Acidobacteriaceae bacterium]
MRRVSAQILAALLLAIPFFWVSLLHAQRIRDPLTPREADQIANLRDQPNQRIQLFQKFLQQRIDAIKAIGPSPRANDLKTDLRDKYQEFTRLSDELQDNLDTFDEAHADIRKALKKLIPAATRWPAILKQAAPDRTYDFSRETALDSAQGTQDQARQLYESQKKYFQIHKHQRGKNGTGPS